MAITVKFTDDEKAEVDRALRTLSDMIPDVDDLEACGVECEAMREALRERAAQLTAIRDRYMV